ncbi:serine palmitoyltransferase component [Suhomyces tanzawaensis NRRL Y-17324]|uniref:serine C-palmitoyltransferase n=1 Tax=Suhomyces tanzawaensis NRRL Y-17324 TaxID=984487 RepID=A0A1E4SNT7_9ASCO|nr:serine palmitoyltransferase component [Suhomyces tanzawaensis NRRL Y-17324]ODV81190.1 serine palmitoyltransferase component [Suhomyces tanzawaensis NRRL Y-17324]
MSSQAAFRNGGPVPPVWDLVTASLADTFVRYLNHLEKIPGGQIILRYIKSSYKNDPIRSLFELALFIFACHYFLSSKKKENKADIVRFSPKEIDELCKEWEPEPLVEAIQPLEKWQLKSVPEIVGHNGAYVNLEGHNGKVTNLATLDFLNLNHNENIKNAAKATISTTGVGACGPPNFYGTQDVHVRLEEDIARYLDGEKAILYGQDFVTAGSVIPAFLKRGDLCVVDSGVNLAIQKALIVSRCDIEWYIHNDMEDLEKVLKELKPDLDKQKPIKRRFIITEGLFSNTGDIANLPKIVELKNKFKYRLFLDESLSIGILGKTGKGIVEHYNIPRTEISITIGSMATSFAASGGFCVGVNPMVHHQRIQSLAYVFSASLPPYSARVASQAIKEISILNSEGNSEVISQLKAKTQFLYEKLTKVFANSAYISIISDSSSPTIHLSLNPSFRSKLNFPLQYGNTHFLNTGKMAKKVNPFDQYHNLESYILQSIIDEVLARSNILITRSKILLEHENLPVSNPHLLINVNIGVSMEDFARLANALNEVVNSVCSSLQSEADLIRLNETLAQ